MRAGRWVGGALVAAAVGVASWTVPAPAADPPAPAAQVAVPWRAGEPELGVQVYWVDDPAAGPGDVRRAARRVLDLVVGLEANAVAFSFPFYVDAIDADAVVTDATTPTPDRVALVVEEARRSGLRVTLRPLLDEFALRERDPQDWRGRLDPADRAAWFASYTAFLRPYLELAQREQVATFSVGVEFSLLQDDPGWAGVVAAAREVYDGEISYSANWDAYAGAVAGVPADVVGIDAYPQLDVAPGSDEDELAAAWVDWLDETRAPRPATLLTEVGAAAEAATVDNPAVPERPGEPLDVGAQATWFAAACRAARELDMGGLYWWRVPFESDPATADPVADRHDSFLGRPAEDAVRECFTSWTAP